MRLSTAQRFVVGGLILAAVGGYEVESHRKLENMGKEANAKAATLVEDVGRRFSVGSPRSDVMAFLHSQVDFDARSDSDDEQWFYTGDEPSHVWYCGPISVGLLVVFKNDRLSEAKVERRALNCL